MAYEYTTASLVQAELQSSTAFSSSTTPTLSDVTNWIQEESAYINSLADTTFSSTAVSSEFIDFDGGSTIWLEYAPIISVSRVQYNANRLGSSTTDWADKVADSDYTIYNDAGYLAVLSGWTPKTGRKRVAVDYTYGYTTTPLEVQMLCTKLVARRVLETLIAKNVNERNDGGTVSVGSISIVEPSTYGVNSYRQLMTDIADLKKNIVDNFKIQRRLFHWYA